MFLKRLPICCLLVARGGGSNYTVETWISPWAGGQWGADGHGVPPDVTPCQGHSVTLFSMPAANASPGSTYETHYQTNSKPRISYLQRPEADSIVQKGQRCKRQRWLCSRSKKAEETWPLKPTPNSMLHPGLEQETFLWRTSLGPLIKLECEWVDLSKA